MLSILTALLVFSSTVYGHGRLREPLSRSSMWRDIGDPAVAPYTELVVPNYNDNQLFCGGFQHQQSLGGKCGVCGDPYDGARDNEAGGIYAKGIITRQYIPGSWIEANIEITAHHKGYFEFRLCPWNNPTVPITQDCLDQYLLENDHSSNTKWQLPPPQGDTQLYSIQLKLPDGIECDQCVLQWRYHTGNTWDCDDDGTCCDGCGPQEEFYGCADVAIGTGPTQAPPNTVDMQSTTKSATIISSATTTSSANVVTSSASAPTTSTATTTGNSICPNGGSGQHLYTCDSFYSCSSGQVYIYNCAPGTVYDEARSICDFAYNVPPPCGTLGTE